MVIACPQLKLAKAFNVIPSIEDPFVHEYIVEKYVTDYYKGELKDKSKPEPLSNHKMYLSRARILCTYVVEP